MNKSKSLLVGCVAVVGLSGCAVTEQFTDSELTRHEGTAVGAAIGATAGALIGGDKESALFGAMVGATIGHLFADHVANKKEDYADNESYMKDVIAESDKMIALSVKEREKLVADIAAYNEQMEALEKDNSELSVRHQKYAVQKQKLQKSLDRTDKLVTFLREEIKIQQDVLAKERENTDIVLVSHSEKNISAMETEIEQVDKHKDSLNVLANQLASLDNRIMH